MNTGQHRNTLFAFQICDSEKILPAFLNQDEEQKKRYEIITPIPSVTLGTTLDPVLKFNL
jgi:hypothetical protein